MPKKPAEPTEPARPPYPGTRLHPFRIADDLWADAMDVAKSRGENLSAHVVRPALERYVKRHRRA
jgi:hypothetical protein